MCCAVTSGCMLEVVVRLLWGFCGVSFSWWGKKQKAFLVSRFLLSFFSFVRSNFLLSYVLMQSVLGFFSHFYLRMIHQPCGSKTVIVKLKSDTRAAVFWRQFYNHGLVQRPIIQLYCVFTFNGFYSLVCIEHSE